MHLEKARYLVFTSAEESSVAVVSSARQVYSVFPILCQLPTDIFNNFKYKTYVYMA
jgi:hypothetical protein